MVLNSSNDHNPQLQQVFGRWGICEYILGSEIKILTIIFGSPAAIYGLTLSHNNA